MSRRRAEARTADDAVRSELRWIGVVIMVVLLAAAILLYVFPGEAGEPTDAILEPLRFAWPVGPEMSAMFMGSCYGAGAYFFHRVSFGGRWHAVAAYFPGIAVFAWLMGAATFLHWDRFNHDHVSFFTWLVLYVVTPFLVPLLYVRNRDADDGRRDQHDSVVPAPVRGLAGLGGVALVATAAVMYVAPSVAIGDGPWMLTPLTSRVIAAFLAALGTASVLLSRDPRWSAWRVFTRAAVISAGLLAVAGARAWDELDSSNPLLHAFLGGVGGVFVAGVVLDRVMERRSRSTSQTVADGRRAERERP
jgi:hypothetical protein